MGNLVTSPFMLAARRPEHTCPACPFEKTFSDMLEQHRAMIEEVEIDISDLNSSLRLVTEMIMTIVQEKSHLQLALRQRQEVARIRTALKEMLFIPNFDETSDDDSDESNDENLSITDSNDTCSRESNADADADNDNDTSASDTNSDDGWRDSTAYRSECTSECSHKYARYLSDSEEERLQVVEKYNQLSQKADVVTK